MQLKEKKKLNFSMTYNSENEDIIIPEYGRNVQLLIRTAEQEADPEKQQALCEEIINLIQRLYPQARNIEDYREKLWKHIYRISKYRLTAKTPSGVTPSPADERKKPERVPYPVQQRQFRHYGNHLVQLIAKAKTLEEGPIKEGFTHTIGSYMKMAYRTWNKDHFISDEIIKRDLATISENGLALKDDQGIDGLSNATRLRSTSNTRPMSTSRDSRSSNTRDGYGRTSNTSNGSTFGRDRNERNDRSDRNKPAPTDSKNRFRKK